MITASPGIYETNTAAQAPAESEPLSFDETVRRARIFCESLPPDFAHCARMLAELQTRLSKGRLHFAILGQFNRGKSTFINALLRIKALPTSVLPLTSVPTIIEYGAKQTCRIRFLDGLEDVIVADSAAKIESALRQYVAEENNPKNRLQVKDATITCPSDLLANGTALIDTPGFGSTHLHNTQTTLDLLAECDAALFLLSADPPMTQTEMEFLRQVKERIPKLFFILNKVDLLSEPELEEVDRFIRGILSRELGFDSGTALYRTCAIKGERAANEEMADKAWAQSGLDAVKKEVLGFMVREKYFTLSEALSGKYQEIIAGVRERLEKKLSGKLTPINAAQQEVSAITGAIQSLSLELESQARRCAEEKDELIAKFDAQARGDAGGHSALSMEKALNAILNGKYFPEEAASIAATMLPKHAADAGARLLASMVNSANKSVRTLALHHTLALANLQKRYAELLGGGDGNGAKQQEPSAEKFIAQIEINTPDGGAAFGSAAWETPQPQMMDIFKKKSVRLDAIKEFYGPLCSSCVSANIEKAAKEARALVDAAWEKMLASIRASYQEMIDTLRGIHRQKQMAVEREREAVKEDVAFLKKKIKECPGG
ncbi:MAG: dynamin family protein [Chitinispirillales bacterium]|jgi:GTP-binding protein EngB required for normal cell division|nr:dynamin family protein [Chitinispirillales bacterium]